MTQVEVADRFATSVKAARRCAIGLYVTSAIWGSLQIVLPENGMFYFATSVLLALLASGWAMFDARSRGIQILPVLQLLYFVIWPVGAVIYLIYRSGVRGLWTALIHGIGMQMALAAAFYLTFYGLHFVGLLDPRYYQ